MALRLLGGSLLSTALAGISSPSPSLRGSAPAPALEEVNGPVTKDIFQQAYVTTETVPSKTCRMKTHGQEPWPDGCKCSDGGSHWNCCMDGGINASGAGGGATFSDSTNWRWLERPGFNWSCNFAADGSSINNGCIDKYNNGARKRGADIVHVPRGASCSTPRVLMIHGDSWKGGGPNETGYFWHGSKLATLTGFIVLAIDFPTAPTCLDYPDCQNVTNFRVINNWILRSAEYLATQVPSVEGSSLPAVGCQNAAGEGPALLFAGDSSGAGSAYSALVTLTSGADSLNGGKDKVSGASLFSGWYDTRCTSPTYISNAFTLEKRAVPSPVGQDINLLGDIMYTEAPSESSWNTCVLIGVNYAGSWQAALDPLVDSTRASPDMLRGMPPLYMSVGGAEVLLGENYVVAQNTAAASTGNHTNEVILDVIDGMFHDFEMYSAGCQNADNTSMWEGDMVWTRATRFLRDAARTGHAPCYRQNPKAVPVTTWHMVNPQFNGQAGRQDMVPAGPLGDGFQCE